MPSSVWWWDSNPWPSEQESPPITTWPGLPPVDLFLVKQTENERVKLVLVVNVPIHRNSSLKKFNRKDFTLSANVVWTEKSCPFGSGDKIKSWTIVMRIKTENIQLKQNLQIYGEDIN